MNKNQARQLAKSIPQDICSGMLQDAIKYTKNWEMAARDNKGMSKGSMWNALFKTLDFSNEIPEIVKYRIIREFEEFLPNEYKPITNTKQKIKPTHFDPDFSQIRF